MKDLRICVGTLAVLLAAGCTGTSGAASSGHVSAKSVGHVSAKSVGHASAKSVGHASATGQVRGKFVMDGGPLGPNGQQPRERPLPGTVTFTAKGHHSVNVRVGPTGRFVVQLLPGRYQVSGKSPRIIEVLSDGTQLVVPCSQALSVTVSANHTAIITVACLVP